MREGGRELKLKSDKDLMAFRATVLKGRDPIRPVSRSVVEPDVGLGEVMKYG